MATQAVAFDWSAFSTRYPELVTAGVNQTLAGAYFNEACLYCDNTGQGPVVDTSVGGTLSLLLNMVTAHIAQLNASLNRQAVSPIVGRIAGVSEGSASFSTANDYPPGSAQWWQQTRYGAAYWAATAQYRSAVYTPKACYQPFGPYPYATYYRGP